MWPIRRRSPLLLAFVPALCAACAAPLHRVLPRPTEPMRRQRTRVRCGVRAIDGRVAFGGGSARGIAHVGIIRWFEEHRIPIDAAAGTSMGGLVGGAFATGWTRRARGHASLARLGSALRRLVFAHKNIRRKADARAYPSRLEFGLKGGIVPPARLNNGEAGGVAPRPDRGSLLRRRGLRRPADTVSNGRGGPPVGASRWSCATARSPMRCGRRCRCH